MTVISLVQTNILRSHSSVRRGLLSEQKRARKFMVAVLFIAILAAGFLYVFQTNNITAEGYKIRNLQKQINESEAINRTLQLDVSNLKSMNMLQAKSETLDMVRARQIDYVSLPKSSAMLIGD